MGILDRFALHGRSAVVTGGGQGIGQALARWPWPRQALTWPFWTSTRSRRRAWPRRSPRWERRSLAIEADVTLTRRVERAITTILGAWGRLDIGVNNAGIGAWADAEAMSEETWDRVIAVKPEGVFLCAQAEGQAMLRQGYGKIINTASMSLHIVNRPQNQVATTPPRRAWCS